MWNFSKLKEGKFYDCGDMISVAYLGGGVLNIRYKGSTVRMDVPSFIQYEWYKGYMQEQQQFMNSQELVPGYGGPDFSSVTIDELETLLSDLIENEDYVGCVKVRNEIKKRKKD